MADQDDYANIDPALQAEDAYRSSLSGIYPSRSTDRNGPGKDTARLESESAGNGEYTPNDFQYQQQAQLAQQAGPPKRTKKTLEKKSRQSRESNSQNTCKYLN
jgi:hypothetical protein